MKKLILMMPIWKSTDTEEVKGSHNDENMYTDSVHHEEKKNSNKNELLKVWIMKFKLTTEKPNKDEFRKI